MVEEVRSTRKARLKNRLVQLDLSEEPYKHALNALRDLWEQGDQPDSIRVRAAFVDDDVKKAGKPPPLGQLVESKGHALRMALLCLFLAQAHSKKPSCIELPLKPGRNDDPSLASLIVAPLRPGMGSTSRGFLDKRAIAVRTALTRLSQPDVQLVELGPKGTYGRFANLTLLEDSGPSSYGTATKYTLPGDDVQVLEIPVDFFLKGWVNVLADGEIATYLMYRQICVGLSPAHITAGERESRFGIGQWSWDQNWVLTGSDLLTLETDIWRRPNGTIDTSDGEDDLRPRPHLFGLADAGLAQDALGAVWKVVDQKAAD